MKLIVIRQINRAESYRMRYIKLVFLFEIVVEGSRMNKYIIAWIACLLSFSLVGCDTMSKQDVGTVTGGAVGALVGSQIGGGTGRSVAIATGAIAGAMIGGNIGRTMDRQDRLYMYNALEGAPTNRSTTWRNPDSGNQYTVIPTRTYQSRGTYCREYTTKAVINGRQQTIYGKACRQPDGSWKAA